MNVICAELQNMAQKNKSLAIKRIFQLYGFLFLNIIFFLSIEHPLSQLNLFLGLPLFISLLGIIYFIHKSAFDYIQLLYFSQKDLNQFKSLAIHQLLFI